MSMGSRVTVLGVIVGTMVLTVGCRSAATEATSRTVMLSNRSGDSLAIRMSELESSYLVDPVPGPVALSAFGFSTLVPPNGEAARDLESVSGYRTGSDLRVWVYRVRTGTVTMVSSFVITDAALKAAQFRIEVAPTPK